MCLYIIDNTWGPSSSALPPGEGGLPFTNAFLLLFIDPFINLIWIQFESLFINKQSFINTF